MIVVAEQVKGHLCQCSPQTNLFSKLSVKMYRYYPKTEHCYSDVSVCVYVWRTDFRMVCVCLRRAFSVCVFVYANTLPWEWSLVGRFE